MADILPVGKPSPALVVNGTAVSRTSLGARRYYEGVMRHLEWSGPIRTTSPCRWRAGERIHEALLRGQRDGLLWSPTHRGPLWARQHVVTVLDCINIEHVYRHDYRLPLLRWAFGQMLRNAIAVITISNATRDAVLRNFAIDPNKIQVIAGPTHFPELCDDATIKPAISLWNSDYVLMVVNQLPHKNTRLACEALAGSSAGRRGIRLRVVGQVDPAGAATCELAGIPVEQYSHVDDRTLHHWMRHARFLFSPSLDEGLNLPIAEALSLGANVLCSDIAVHREFYADRAIFCVPDSCAAMINALNDAFSKEGNWGLALRPGLRRTFSEVANDYRRLFLQASTTAPQSNRPTTTLN
jgi:glycosyltransferase involved in cell wall biosynthesis